MAEQESPAVRNANKQFRKEAQAREGATAWQEYLDRAEATRAKTAKLRAQRLARDASTSTSSAPAPKRAPRTKLAKP
jgi:hypothetical protein